MDRIVSRTEYEAQIAATRDERMDWWRQARFGMFVTFGLYAVEGRHEWLMAQENIPVKEYEKLADRFDPKPGAPREWAKLASEAGMKYMVLVTRHHDGFALWDSKADPFNAVNYGPHRDIVREFVDACREFGLRIGFYSSCMEWHHPDSARAAYDSEARRRYTQYLLELNTELLTNYGRIDILWYDVPSPMESWEGWDSLERNQKLRAIQPWIIINDRSMLPEDFGTPEEHIAGSDRDWEACMTFNHLSWGYIDPEQAKPYSYSPQQIAFMLADCTCNGGNLLLNIGPAPDGSVPPEAVEPLQRVGAWLRENGDAVYGHRVKKEGWLEARYGGNGAAWTTCKGNHIYLWVFLWPKDGTMGVGGYFEAPRSVKVLRNGMPVSFRHQGQRLILEGMTQEMRDPILNITVLDMEFDTLPRYTFASYLPQLHGGVSATDDPQ